MNMIDRNNRKSKDLWLPAVLWLVPLAAVWRGWLFSPSFTLLFMGIAACLIEAAVFVSRLWKWFGTLCVVLACILTLIGAYMYAVGDDHLNAGMGVGLLAGSVLTILLRRLGHSSESHLVRWMLLVTAGINIAWGFASTFLLLPGFAAVLIAAWAEVSGRIKAAKDRKAEQASDEGLAADSEGKKILQNRKVKSVLTLALVAAAAWFALSGRAERMAYQISWFAMDHFSGPVFLSENKEKITDGSDGTFYPGAAMTDTDGNAIQAHGGQIQLMEIEGEETYVWVGEDKRSGHMGNEVAVYTSDDLHQWTFQGDVLQVPGSREELDTDPYFTDLYQGYSDEELDLVYETLNPEAVIERPKMLYNETTGKYVIWFHSDNATELNAYKYDVGMSGVAVSDSPYGPFRFIRRQRQSLCPDGQIDRYPQSKGEARDMNLFKDDDGTAYITYTSENNKTIYISKLNEDYTDLSASPEEAVYGVDYIRIFPGAMREAPALFKGDNGRYYLMTSSTTGWLSNQARLWSADTIFGEWENDGNPCEGEGADVTFNTQDTCVFRSKEGQWIYLGDRWSNMDLADSRYVILPAEFDASGHLSIHWEASWK